MTKQKHFRFQIDDLRFTIFADDAFGRWVHAGVGE